MGFATPFPEPESPDLRRYIVSARPQIVTVLRALCEAAPQINAFVGGGPEFAVATLQRVDEVHGEIHCELPPGRSMSRLTAAEATFVGFVDTDKVQFRAKAMAAEQGGYAFRLPLPELVLRMARRRTERANTDFRRRPACRLEWTDGTTRSLTVCDIGLGGLAVEASTVLAATPWPGLRIDRCRLDLPGVGGAEVSLVIRHSTPLAGSESLVRIGCEFVEPAPKLLTMIDRYLGEGVAETRSKPLPPGVLTNPSPESFPCSG